MLEFSYSCSFNKTDSVLTLALANDTGAVVMGKTYADDVRLATTTETGDAVARGYAFGGTNNDAQVANTSDYTTLGRNFTVNETNTVTFTVAYDSAKSEFVGTLTYDGASKSVDLGDSFAVNAITATFDGDRGYLGYVNDIKLTVSTVPPPAVPEPTTATLSLLALAGLAARRRRK